MSDTAVLERDAQEALDQFDTFFGEVEEWRDQQPNPHALAVVRFAATHYAHGRRTKKISDKKFGDPIDPNLLHRAKVQAKKQVSDLPMPDNDEETVNKLIEVAGLPATDGVQVRLWLLAKDLDDRIDQGATEEQIQIVICKGIDDLARFLAQAA